MQRNVSWNECETQCALLIPEEDADYNGTQGICLQAFWALNATLVNNGKSTFLTDVRPPAIWRPPMRL